MSDLTTYFRNENELIALKERVAVLESQLKRSKDMNTYFRKRLVSFEASSRVVSERKAKCLDLLRKRKSGYLIISMKEIAEKCFFDVKTVHTYSSLVNRGLL